MEKTPEKSPEKTPLLKLYIHSPAWGLSSIDPHSLSAELYLRATGVPHEVIHSRYPYSTVTGTLPYLQWGDEITHDKDLIQHMRKMWCDLDENKTSSENSDIEAYLTLVEENLHYPHLAFQWQSNAGYEEGMEKAYAKQVPFPINIYLRVTQRKEVIQLLSTRRLQDPKRAEKIGSQCLQNLSDRLGDQYYFFSNKRPSTLDFVVAAHTATIYHFPWKNPLKTALSNHPKLIQHFLSILSTYGQDYSPPKELVEQFDRTHETKKETLDLYIPKINIRQFKRKEKNRRRKKRRERRGGTA